MFDKFNLDALKKQTVEKLSDTSDDLVLTISSSTSKAKGAVNLLKDSIGDTKDFVKDFGVGKIKEFALDASSIVTEIDAHLLEKNLPYAVNNFRVSANVGVMAGMVLDIQFAKNTNTNSSIGTHNKSAVDSNTVDITNPNTGKLYKVPREHLVNKEKAKIKDPDTGELLIIDVKTRQITEVVGNNKIEKITQM